MSTKMASPMGVPLVSSPLLRTTVQVLLGHRPETRQDVIRTPTTRVGLASLVLPLCLLAVVLAAIVDLTMNSGSRVDSLVQDLNSQSPTQRIWAAQTLGHLKDASAVTALDAALKDPDPTMRRCAIRAIGQINCARSAEILASAMGHWDGNVRREAAASLSKRMGHPKAHEATLAQLK